MRIPPMRLLREGARNEALIELFLNNVRVPNQVLGDLEAQVTANEVCAARVAEFLAGCEAGGPPGARPCAA